MAVDGVDIVHGGVPSVTRTVEGVEMDCGHDRLSGGGIKEISSAEETLQAGCTGLREPVRLDLSREEEVVERDSQDVTMTRRSQDTVLLRIRQDAFPR